MFRKIFASALGLTSILLMSLLGACSSYEPLARTKIIRSANEISPVDESVLVCAGDNKAKYKDVKAAVDQHVLVVNSWGHVKGDTYRDRFLKIIKAFEKSKSRHMLIYVNGGLNSETVILNRAARQIRCMTKNTDYFPVFLAWKTGAFETYFDQITYARNGVRHRNAQISAPMYLFGDIGQGLARAPITFYNSGRRFLESTLIVDKDEYTLSDDIRKIRERRPEYRNVDIDWDADTKPAEALPTKLLKVTGYALAWPGRILTTPFSRFHGQDGVGEYVAPQPSDRTRRDRLPTRNTGTATRKP